MHENNLLKKVYKEENLFKKKNKMKLLTNEKQGSYEKAKICYICEEKVGKYRLKAKKIVKLKIIVFIQVNIEVLHIAYVI